MNRNIGLIVLFLAGLPVGCSDNKQTELPRAKAELAKPEEDRTRSEFSKPPVADSTPASRPATNPEKERRRREIEKSIIDLESELPTAESKDAEDKKWNDEERQRLLDKVEEGRKEAKRLRQEGKTGQAAAGEFAAGIAEASYGRGEFTGKRDTNRGAKLREQIASLRKQLVDLRD